MLKTMASPRLAIRVPRVPPVALPSQTVYGTGQKSVCEHACILRFFLPQMGCDVPPREKREDTPV